MCRIRQRGYYCSELARNNGIYSCGRKGLSIFRKCIVYLLKVLLESIDYHNNVCLFSNNVLSR